MNEWIKAQMVSVIGTQASQIYLSTLGQQANMQKDRKPG